MAYRLQQEAVTAAADSTSKRLHQPRSADYWRLYQRRSLVKTKMNCFKRLGDLSVGWCFGSPPCSYFPADGCARPQLTARSAANSWLSNCCGLPIDASMSFKEKAGFLKSAAVFCRLQATPLGSI